MSDIFLSYASEDRELASALADALERHGWMVWWDRRIPAGRTYAEVIDDQLGDARCVVVLWSKASVASHWVNTEAAEANNRRVLVPILIEPVRIPLEFRRIQAADLTDWRAGAEAHPGLKMLVTDLEALLGRPATSPPPTPLGPSAPPISFKELSLSEIQENARRAIKESVVSRPKGGARLNGIFICYRRDDSAGHAGRLYEGLTAHFGHEHIFMDVDSIEPGEDFVQVIEEAVGSCEILLVLIGRSWLTSSDEQRRRLDNPHDFVRLELAAALARDVRIIPVLVQGAQMPRQHDLPEDISPLARRNAFELSDLRWRQNIKGLIQVLEKLLKD